MVIGKKNEELYNFKSTNNYYFSLKELSETYD